MLSIQLVDRVSSAEESLLDMLLNCPPPGWIEMWKKSEDEIRLACANVSRLGSVHYPPKEQVVRAYDLCPLNNVRVVVLGQDPYHTPGQANGLAFSTNVGVQPSLENIYTELENEFSEQRIAAAKEELLKNADIFTKDKPSAQDKALLFRLFSLASHPVFKRPKHGNLKKWADQGVLLLNTCLTVAPHQPGSHGSVWNGLITRTFEAVAEANPECIYLLWGGHAMKIGNDPQKLSQRSIKLYATHPSPFSARKASKDAPAFIGCDHFRQTNEFLIKQGRPPIDWTLD